MSWHPPSGVKPHKKDHRDFSFQRTFGSIAGAELPSDLNLDAGLTNRSQNADGLFYGCTGYTQSDIATDEDKRVYDPRFTYDQTLTMMGVSQTSPQWETVGCDLRTSLNSTIVYGLKPFDGVGQPFEYRRGSYYAVEPLTDDWFDTLRQTMLTNKRPLSVASPWFPDFGDTPNGILNTPVDYNLARASYHNYKICGWATNAGITYLQVKAWYGQGWGQNGNGIALMSREILNTLMTLNGSGVYTLAPYTGANVKLVQLTILETIVSYLRWIISLLTKKQ